MGPFKKMLSAAKPRSMCWCGRGPQLRALRLRPAPALFCPGSAGSRRDLGGVFRCSWCWPPARPPAAGPLALAPGEAPLTYCLCCQDLPPCPTVTPRLVGGLPSGAVSAATWSFSAGSDLTPCLLPDDSQCVLSLLPHKLGAASHLLLCRDVESLSSALCV